LRRFWTLFITEYWLDINNSVTSILNNSYNLNIVVSNNGRISIATIYINSFVIIYGLIPSNFMLNGTIIKSNPIYCHVVQSTNPTARDLSGNLFQMVILPTNLKKYLKISNYGLKPVNSPRAI
jgi:hypothetical protein